MRIKSSWLPALLVVSAFALLTGPALAQDAPPPTDTPRPPDIPVANTPGVASPAPDAPPAVTAPPPAPSAAPDAPAAASAPPTGSAAFAPLPGAPPQPAPKKRAHPPRPAPVPAVAPDASTALAPDAAPSAPADTYHHSSPGGDEASEGDKKSDDTDGVFGPFRVGFLVGGGLPDLLSLGGMVKVTRFVGIGVNAGIIPTVKLSLYGQAQLAYQEYDVYGHIFPFGGAFFLGAGVGYATIKGSLSNSYTVPPQYVALGVPSPVSVESQGSVRTLVLTPQIGLLKTFGPGFTIGLDVGAQLPIAPSKVDNKTQAPSYVPADQVKPYDDKVHSTLTSIGRTVLPTFNFKIGWLL